MVGPVAINESVDLLKVAFEKVHFDVRRGNDDANLPPMIACTPVPTKELRMH